LLLFDRCDRPLVAPFATGLGNPLDSCEDGGEGEEDLRGREGLQFHHVNLLFI
jgi:hypothetical protein